MNIDKTHAYLYVCIGERNEVPSTIQQYNIGENFFTLNSSTWPIIIPKKHWETETGVEFNARKLKYS